MVKRGDCLSSIGRLRQISWKDIGDDPENSLMVSEKFIRRAHFGIDVAATEGAHVLAACGGILNFSQARGVAGDTVTIHPDLRSPQLLHHRELPAKKGMIVKAGEIVAVTARTGNPDQNSPTHVHEVFNGRTGCDMAKPVAPDQTPVIPNTHLPEAVPCGCDQGDDLSGEHDSDNPRNRGLRIEGGNKRWSSCWVHRANTHPFATRARGRLRSYPSLPAPGSCLER